MAPGEGEGAALDGTDGVDGATVVGAEEDASGGGGGVDQYEGGAVGGESGVAVEEFGEGKSQMSGDGVGFSGGEGDGSGPAAAGSASEAMEGAWGGVGRWRHGGSVADSGGRGKGIQSGDGCGLPGNSAKTGCPGRIRLARGAGEGG